MKFFDYEEIFIAAHGDPTSMLHYFRSCKTGKDFIVNQKALVDAFWLTDRDKAEYLGICALRNYEDYAATGYVDLKIDLIPEWVPLEIIKQNPLVKVTNTEVILKEEKK